MTRYRQYVNLDPSKPEQLKELPKVRAGRSIELVAKLNHKIANVPVLFAVVSGADNVVTALDDKNFDAKDLALYKKAHPGLGNPGRAERKVLTDKDGAAHITFYVSEYGGDTFTVKAYLLKKSGDKGPELVSDEYVVWRRIYYQVSRFMGGPKAAGRGGVFAAVPKLTWESIAKEFKARNHNIELIEDSYKDLIKRHENVLKIGPNLLNSAKDSYNDKRGPVALRVVLVNQISIPAVIDYEAGPISATTPANVITDWLWYDESLAKKDDWFISGTWSLMPASYVGPMTSVVLNALPAYPLDKKYVERSGKDLIVVKMPDEAKTLGGPAAKVYVTLQLRTLDGSANGLSYHSAIWLASENMYEGARTDNEKQATTIHEIGHFIGMVPAPQSTHYIEHGHKGNHCSQGLSPADRAKAKYSGLHGTCIMFGENAVTRKSVFCGVCDKSVRTSRVIATETLS